MKTFSEAFITKDNIKDISSKSKDKVISLSDIDCYNKTREDVNKIKEAIMGAGLWPENVNNGNIWDFKWAKRGEWLIDVRAGGIRNCYTLAYKLYDNRNFMVTENHILRFYPNCIVPCDRFKRNTHLSDPRKAQLTSDMGPKCINMAELLDNIAELFGCEYRNLYYNCAQEIGFQGIYTEPDVYTVTIGTKDYDIKYKE